jgi:hypothetical protein
MLRDQEIEQARRLWAKLKKPWVAKAHVGLEGIHRALPVRWMR